ncbi:RHS repeat domain-containing protein [Streptomyces sp900116325]|uniref:RHS repeat domain-containing protein n=1 Tax=Streptomyces sp. 900116325 TaxID=3154295 RepID=A0ABV2UHD4_9ACTN
MCETTDFPNSLPPAARKGHRLRLRHGREPDVGDHTGEKARFAYDAAGRILTKTDPRGNVTGADPASRTKW